jgi:hypothetical protein
VLKLSGSNNITSFIGSNDCADALNTPVLLKLALQYRRSQKYASIFLRSHFYNHVKCYMSSDSVASIMNDP